MSKRAENYHFIAEDAQVISEDAQAQGRQAESTLNKDALPRNSLTLAVGKQISVIRKMRGMTGRELGKKLNVSQQQISRYERGICQIDVATLIHMLYILEISIDHFFTNVSLRLSELSPEAYTVYHSLFFPVINVSNKDYILMRSSGEFI
ncbi:helix-turn-helix domain-containing protein [Providencia sp. PROV236]|uniref:helix-turn-helix domain-containing protein n=1 Tax=Providencia sp. PROV236 TaxID=2936798 RepID=UPI0034E218D7